MAPTEEVADSWEDEADESGNEDSTTTKSIQQSPPSSKDTMGTSSSTRQSYPPQSEPLQFAPDGTPISNSSRTTRLNRTGEDGDARRPEKTNAVASRLIAAGLGVRAPKKTKEQLAYQSAVMEKEKKARDEARERERRRAEEAQRARDGAWGD